jgi:diacylglycerol kinase (ATP)
MLWLILPLNKKPFSMLFPRKIIYLVNPISGTKKKDDVISYIKITTEAKQISFEIIDTVANGDYSWLVEKIAKENTTDVVILGGDGTINYVLASLKNIKINIGIIPSGSGNGLAFAAKIPKDYKKALDIVFNNKTQLTDAFTVNNKFACMLSGIGFDAQVAYDFAQQEKRGLITYTKQSLLNFFKANPYPFEVTVDNFSFFVDAFFISVANSNQFGNHFTIAPKASLSDGLLDIVIVQKMSKLKMPFAILQQIRGKNKLQDLVNDLQKKNIIYLQTSSIKITNKQLAPIHIDGDVAVAVKQFEFTILKDYFCLLVP